MSAIKPLYSNIKLNVAITSDNHIDINSGKQLKKRIGIIKKVLAELKESTTPFDAYITVGDTTSRGIDANWELIKDCFKGEKPAKQIIFATGNHDLWDESGYKGYKNGIANYYKYCKEICSQDIDTPFYERVINGYHFIILGSTDVAFDEDCAAFGNEEIEWLDATLNKASESGKPIFIFCHQTVNGKHGLPRTWSEKEKDWAPEIGGIGEESDAVEKIINKYKNVYYFSGHSHMGLCGTKSMKKNGYASFEEHNGVNYINLPCLTRSNHHGQTKRTGIGCLLEVYDDKVVVRPRNFEKGKMNKRIIIKDDKPYFENSIK